MWSNSLVWWIKNFCFLSCLSFLQGESTVTARFLHLSVIIFAPDHTRHQLELIVINIADIHMKATLVWWCWVVGAELHISESHTQTNSLVFCVQPSGYISVVLSIPHDLTTSSVDKYMYISSKVTKLNHNRCLKIIKSNKLYVKVLKQMSWRKRKIINMYITSNNHCRYCCCYSWHTSAPVDMFEAVRTDSAW